MISIIISVVVVVALFVVLGISTDGWELRKRQVFSLFGLIFCLFGCITIIPANSVGIVYSPFHGTEDKTISEGFHTKNLFDKVYKISTEVQTTAVENLTTQTKDAQFVNSTLDIKYRVNSSEAYLVFKQYKTLDRMSKTLIVPTTQRTLELITTNYNVIDILGEKRTAIYTELETSLSKEFEKYGVEFYSISITDMDAGEALENAISEEAVAKKAVETAEQNLLKAEKEAKQKSVQAQAEQDAAKIEAETKVILAESEKRANDILNESLSNEILKKEWIDKWDGKMPTYYSGSEEGMGIIVNPSVDNSN